MTEFQARRLIPQFVTDAELQLAAARTRAERAAPQQEPTFRELAHAWLNHLETVEDVKPSTLRDYRSLLAEPDIPYRRGKRRTLGRIMRALGDMPVTRVATADIEALLADLDQQCISRRTVNKYRETLHAMFRFGLSPSQRAQWALDKNPVADTRKRCDAEIGHLEVFTVEQVEALAGAAERGDWRTDRGYATPNAEHLRRDENQQLADLLRVAAYTGLRRGELVALRWEDVAWGDPCDPARRRSDESIRPVAGV